MDPLFVFLRLFTDEETEPSHPRDNLTEEERVLKKVKSLLKCLAERNLEKVKDELVQMIGGAMSVPILQSLVSCIFDMAIAEDAFVLMGHLCAELSASLPHIPSNDYFGKEMTFKRLLLDKCQFEFENTTKTVDGLLVDHSDCKLVGLRLLGTILLLAELFKWKLVPEKICHHVIQELTNRPLEKNIKSVCQFISSIGKVMDSRTSSRRVLDVHFIKLDQLLRNPLLTQRSRGMIFNLVQLRANNWVKIVPRFRLIGEDLSCRAAAMTSRGASDNYNARELKPDSSEKGDHLPATQPVEEVEDDVLRKLGKALEEIEISRQQAREERAQRIVAEKDTREAILKAGLLGSKYSNELRLRQETEDVLNREREELEKTRLLLETCQKERDNALKITDDLLKNQAEERSLRTFCYQDEHQMPSCFFCPISQEVMTDPQVAADGFTYEAEAIRKWIDSGHATSPMTNLKLPHLALVPNHALRSAIGELNGGTTTVGSSSP